MARWHSKWHSTPPAACRGRNCAARPQPPGGLDGPLERRRKRPDPTRPQKVSENRGLGAAALAAGAAGRAETAPEAALAGWSARSPASSSSTWATARSTEATSNLTDYSHGPFMRNGILFLALPEMDAEPWTRPATCEWLEFMTTQYHSATTIILFHRAIEDTTPAAASRRTSSIVLVSAAVLSCRYRFTRAKRSVRPP